MTTFLSVLGEVFGEGPFLVTALILRPDTSEDIGRALMVTGNSVFPVSYMETNICENRHYVYELEHGARAFGRAAPRAHVQLTHVRARPTRKSKINKHPAGTLQAVKYIVSLLKITESATD